MPKPQMRKVMSKSAFRNELKSEKKLKILSLSRCDLRIAPQALKLKTKVNSYHYII